MSVTQMLASNKSRMEKAAIFGQREKADNVEELKNYASPTGITLNDSDNAPLHPYYVRATSEHQFQLNCHIIRFYSV